MDFLPDVDNFLQLTAQQRSAVVRMVTFMLGRPAHWPIDEELIVREAILYRQQHNMHVFPHIELEPLVDEMEVEEPVAAPNTPDITE